MDNTKLLYSRDEMKDECVRMLNKRGVTIPEIAQIAFDQQARYTDNIKMEDCIESVYKILSLRDTFHIVLFSCEVDRLVEDKAFEGPIQEIMAKDLGVFGVDEVIGLAQANLYGVIGQTNFGHIDVDKPGVVGRINDAPKTDPHACHTFLDDVVGAIAAAASTRVAQMDVEEKAKNR